MICLFLSVEKVYIGLYKTMRLKNKLEQFYRLGDSIGGPSASRE